VLAGGLANRLQADTALVFNEVMYHPATNEPALEWVEFYNQMAVDLDVSGWHVTGDIAFTFPEGTRAPGQGYLVLAIDPEALATETGLTSLLGPYTNRLSNAGGTLELRNADGRLMDQLRFGTRDEWPVAPDGAGVSLAKLDRDWGSAAPDHWAASAEVGGTPGRENFPAPDAPGLGVGFNETSGTADATFWVELRNRGAEPVVLEGWVLRVAGATDADFVLPEGPSLEAGGFHLLDEGALGFRPGPGDRLFLFTPDRTRVADGVVVEEAPRARFPDGYGRWWRPAEPSPGATNQFRFPDDVVIHEIMYHPALAVSPETGAPAPSDGQWIELYNRGTNVADLSGWELGGGIAYRFAVGQRLAPGAYLVVARDAAALRAEYPGLDIVGDFAGRLSRRGERLWLRDAAGNPADEVHYYDRGPWPAAADGGGSSLELRDPFADNARPEAWAASDESGKSAWETVTYRRVAGFPSGTQPTQWNDFILGLLDAGECLIDDLRVVEAPAGTPVELVNNGDFENGLTGWRALGTHRHSRVITDPDQPGNHVLHLVATGPQEHMHNHLETTLRNGRSVVNGREYEVSFRARWLTGNPRLNTRLYFNRVARTTGLNRPTKTGTPGAPNSRFTPHLGPTFGRLQHTPVVPNPGTSVTVSVPVQDPQGVAAVTLWWSVNGGAWANAPMVRADGGSYAAAIPGNAAGTIVQFYVEAADRLGASASHPPAGRHAGALYVVKDNQADPRRGHNLRLVMTPANRDLLHAFTNVMSNEELPATVIYNDRRAYYDVGLRLKGSQRGRYSDTRVSFHLAFPPDDLFRDVHPVMLIDRSGAGDATGNKQLEVLIKHLLTRVGGIPGPPVDLCKVIAPRNLHSSSAILAPRHEDEYLETGFANGGDGTLFELELLYYPTTANAAGYKQPQPDNVLGVDFQDLGADLELYRYNFMIKNHRDGDDYRPLMRFAQALGLTGPTLEPQTRNVMDLEAWTRAWALVSLCGVGDSYTFGNDHNLLLYLRPADGRFVPFPVDMDFSFVRGATSGLLGDRNLTRVFNLPANLRRFYAHVLELIEVGFNPAYMGPWVTHYNRFVPEQNFASITEYIRQRGNYAVATINAAGGNAPFAVSGPTPLTTSANLVTLSGTAPVTLHTLRVNGIAWPLSWTSISQWKLQLPVTSATNVLELAGFDGRGRALANAVATRTVVYTGPPVVPEGAVVFNEIMYHPEASRASFVELLNRAPDTAFDLSGWRIDGLALTFPPGTSLAAGQYLLLAGDRLGFADAYGAATPLPGAVYPGNLRHDGEVLTLLRPGPGAGEEVRVDQVGYEHRLPWPLAADGLGPSLQLIDPAQDNRRVANWAAAEPGQAVEPRWVQALVQGTATSSSLYLYLESAGDLYLDDLWLVPGTVAEAGVNAVRNGDFEAPLSGPWVVSPNHAESALSATLKRSGNASLHLVARSGGTTRASAIYQELSPALAEGQPYTLSFWYRQSTNGGPFTARLSGRGLTLTVDPAPAASGPYSPGTANTVARDLTPFPAVWLNEVQTRNQTGPADQAGEREAWIELFNAGPEPVSLAGLSLAATIPPVQPWALPPELTLEPGGYLLIWADGEPAESSVAELHTDFRLSDAAGSVVLLRQSAGGPEILDYLHYDHLAPDQSYGSLPDGEPFGRRLLAGPTPGVSNQSPLPPATVLINEWMAANTVASGIADPADNRYQDWFELYNPEARDVSLQDWGLSDDSTRPFKFRIPAGYAVPARGFLLVWADEETAQNQPDRADLHVNFRLSQDGEAIVLTRPDGSVADLVTFGPQRENVSQGRVPDGAPSIQTLPTPTPRGANAGQPPAPPEFTVIQLLPSGSVRLTVRTQTGREYRVEFADDLGAGDWQPLGDARTADGGSLEFEEASGVRTSRFYRAVLLP
jgi:hypothetical protein